MKKLMPLLLFLACTLATASSGQQNPQKKYGMVAGNDETVRLDPGYYHTGPTYQAGLEGKKIQVEVDAEKPVTLAIASAQDWNNASQHPDTLGSLNYSCVQEHVVKATYTCDLPPKEPKVLVVRDERGAFAGLGEVVGGRDRNGRDRDRDRDRQISDGLIVVLSSQSPRQFLAPNNVHIQYYDWGCVENCNLPDPPHDRVFNWVPGNEETLRLDPADYHAGRTYNPGGQGGNIQVDIEAREPVTVGLAPEEDWKHVFDAVLPRDIKSIDFLCVQRHTIKITYVCNLQPSAWGRVLVIRDERGDGRDAEHRDTRGVGNSVPTAGAAPARVHNAADRREFTSPNEVHIQYYSWRCVAYCDQPVFQWVSQVREKYELTNIVKVYGGITPDHDGEQVSIRVKSPVPMAVAILPSNVAGRLYGKPDMFESEVGKSSCQQRGVQSSTFQCQFNVADGPQSLVLLPEPGANIPRKKKKTEVEVQAVKCVANCNKLPSAN